MSGDTLTITSADTNTTYSAGTGLNLSSTEFSLSAGLDNLSDCSITASDSIFIGVSPGSLGLTPQYNVGIAIAALDSLTTGDYNICIGRQAGNSITSGSTNVMIGHQSGINHAATGNGFNTYMGYQAGYGASSETGTSNVGIGAYALEYISSGSNNTAVGRDAGDNSSGLSGSNNCIFGYQCGVNMTDASGCICIGSGADISPLASTPTNRIVIGTSLVESGSDNNIYIGDSSSYIYNDFSSNASWSHSSDIRMKHDIKDEYIGLNFINKLKPKTYKLKAPSEFPKEWTSYDPEKTKPVNKNIITGFIAQDIKEALDSEKNTTLKCWDIKEDSQQTISTTELIVPLVNAIKELTQRVKYLEEEIKDLIAW